MAGKKKIKIHGTDCKKFTKYPFFANAEVKKDMLLSRLRHHPKPLPKNAVIIKFKKDPEAQA